MDYKFIGASCGEHGPYKFYKALKFTKNSKTSILSLSDFFFVRLWTDSDLISIGELQLLWEDKNSEQSLASLRLYILPENTPEGRTSLHGEDEVLAITEKVVIRIEDLLTWISHATAWSWGLRAIWDKDCPQNEHNMPYNTIALDMEDIQKEKQMLGPDYWVNNTGVIVLSFQKYCRYRALIKRLEGVTDKWMRTTLLAALGGFTAPWKDTRILFCKDTFDYPELEGHELLCNHLAPKLKGRPRKRKKNNASPDESESESISSQSSMSKSKANPAKANMVKPRLRCTLQVASRPRGPSGEEKAFMASLHHFMRERKTPINRIPVVGFKEVNLFNLFKKVKELGGYDLVCSGKLWKYVYEVMGGDMASTSAATLSRRHYEKLLLPFEKHINGMKNNKHQNEKVFSIPAAIMPRLESKAKTPTTPSSSLRNIRHKPEKVVREKENIPQRRESTTSNPVVKVETDAGHSSDGDSAAKSSTTITPLIKKQKLDILKEGGLEVTPVASSRTSVIKQATPPHTPPAQQSPGNNKISITVTPDMSHLLCSPGPSKRPVYGNPKEIYSERSKEQLVKKYSLPEVLDLRTKPRLNIGSNLEITLVPPKNVQKPVTPPSIVPATKKKNFSKTPTQIPKQNFQRPYQGGYKPAYMPVMDPLYLSAIYNHGVFNQQFNQQPEQVPPEHLNLYKELFRRQSMFPNLLKDGTTSITLVGQTPTSK